MTDEATTEWSDDLQDKVYRAMFAQARKRGGERYALTFDDEYSLVQRAEGRCELSDIPFEFGAAPDGKRHYKRPWAPSLDRIDSTLGYSAGNVRLVCVAVNMAMNQWGERALMRIAEGVLLKNHRRVFNEFEKRHIGHDDKSK